MEKGHGVTINHCPGNVRSQSSCCATPQRYIGVYFVVFGISSTAWAAAERTGRWSSHLFPAIFVILEHATPQFGDQIFQGCLVYGWTNDVILERATTPIGHKRFHDGKNDNVPPSIRVLG